jgi:2-dehydropantoate 2-reductase
MSSPHEVLIFGAGAVGSVLGGLMQRAGHRVTLLGRPTHVAAIAEHGLHIDGIWGEHRVAMPNACSHPDELAGRHFDLILLTVKAYDTAEAARALQTLATPDCWVVSLQNGFGNTQILEAALGPRVLGARVITGVEVVEAGHVRVTVSADDIRLGPPADEADRMPIAEQIATELRAAGVPVSATDRYREYLWAKILYNAALNPLGALLHARYGELAADTDCRAIMDRVMDEAFAVTQAAAIPLFWSRASDYRRHFYDDLIPPTASHYPSMYRDLQRRGRTEIDALNGAIVHVGARHACAAPTNQMLTAMIHLREQTRRAELA